MHRVLAFTAALLVASPVARAQEVCGNLVNDADPSTTHLADEGCFSAGVTGVCESPISCGSTGAVAPKTGQLVYNEPADIAPHVPYGPPLSLARNYASLAADQAGYLASLGKGWKHSFMGALDPVTAETDEVIVRLVTGQEVLLTFDDEDPTSTYDLYTPQPGYHIDTLRRHQTLDVWELITLEGWTYEYDDSSCGGLRMLTRIEDPFGQALALTYDGSCYLTEVTDASGYRDLRFTYDGNSKVDKVDYYLDDVLKVTVDYTVTSDKLETVQVGLTGSFTLIRDYSWVGNKLDLIEDGNANPKKLADFEYLDATPGKVARIKTGEGNLGYRYGDTTCDGGEGLYVYYNDTDDTDAGCDADSDCAGNLCGGEIKPGIENTGVCYRARRCVSLSSSHDDLVDSVTSSGCTTCVDTKSYFWNTNIGLIATHAADDVRTTYARNADGLVTRIVENDDDNVATNTPPSTARTTYYFYDEAFRGRIAEIRRASELPGAQGQILCDDDQNTTNCKQTLYTYEATAGNGAALLSVQAKGFTYGWNGGTPAVVQYDYTSAYDHDSYGRLLEVDGPRSGYDQVNYTYWSSTDPLKDGMLHEVSRALGASSALTTTLDDYDYWGNAKSIQDPNGNFTCRTFHEDLDVLTVNRVAMNNQTSCSSSHTADLITTTSYDTSKRVTKIERPLGNCLHRNYDLWGRLSIVRERDDCNTSSAGQTMERTYNDEGLLIKTEYKDASDTVTYRHETTYGADRRLTEILNPTQSSKKKTIAYEADGMIDSITGEDGVGETEWTYDPLNRAILEQRHLSSSTADDFTIANCKQMDRIVDVAAGPIGEEEPIIERTWDDLRRNVIQVTPDGGTSYSFYDEAGNVSMRVEAFNSTDEMIHEYTYDARNRIVSEDYGDSACFSLGGAEIQYAYDTTTGCPTGACENVTGRLAFVKTKVACDDSDTTDDTFDQFTYFKYDDAGRLVKETIEDDGGRSVSQNYAWDENGNQTLVEPPSGIDMKWTYGSTGSNSDGDKIVSLVRTVGTSDTTLISNATWHPFGPVKDYQQANVVSSTNIVASFALDLAYRPTELRWKYGTTDIFKITHTLDAQGRITARDFSSADSDVQDAWYLYDWQDRILCDSTVALSGSSCSTGTDRKNQLTGSPSYSPSGDRQEIYHRAHGLYTADTFVYDYVDGTHQIDAITKDSTQLIDFYWDGRGNRLYDDDSEWADDRRDYTYDARNNLVSVSGMMRVGTGVVHDYTLINVYDHKNRRFFKSLLDEDTSVESHWYFYYDLHDRLIEVNYTPNIDPEEADNFQVIQFYWVGTRPVARIMTTYPAETQGRRFVHADHLDTPLDTWHWPCCTGQDATRAWSMNPDAFGWGRIVHDPTDYQPLRFPGQYIDEETLAWRYDSGSSDYVPARPALLDNRYRVYDPLTSSYLQVDTRIDEGWQSYVYADGNPVMLSDRMGLGFWDSVTGALDSIWDAIFEGGSSECGGGKWENVPDHIVFFGAYFDSACHGHDECYRDCCSRKDVCDETFWNEMEEACFKYAWFLLPTCLGAAKLYLEVVEGSQGEAAWTFEQNAFGCSDVSSFSCGGGTSPPPIGKPGYGLPADCFEIDSVERWDDVGDPLDEPDLYDPRCAVTDPYGMMDVLAK
jgi:RHS repeat-associated protein